MGCASSRLVQISYIGHCQCVLSCHECRFHACAKTFICLSAPMQVGCLRNTHLVLPHTMQRRWTPTTTVQTPPASSSYGPEIPFEQPKAALKKSDSYAEVQKVFPTNPPATVAGRRNLRNFESRPPPTGAPAADVTSLPVPHVTCIRRIFRLDISAHSCGRAASTITTICLSSGSAGRCK